MKWLIGLYPRAWRERYIEEFKSLLEDSPKGWRTGLDVLRGAMDAQSRTPGLMKRLLPAALVLLADLIIGWLNYHAADDVQPVAAALIIAGFGFTFWRPRLAWWFVAVLWLAVPASSIVGYATNHHPGVAKPAPLYETLVALVPTALGAGAAALLRRLPKRAS